MKVGDFDRDQASLPTESNSRHSTVFFLALIPGSLQRDLFFSYVYYPSVSGSDDAFFLSYRIDPLNRVFNIAPAEYPAPSELFMMAFEIHTRSWYSS